MAFEITKQELLRQANELLKKYNKSKDSDLKAQENRLRRIVSDLDSIGSLSSGVTSFNTRTGAVTLTSSDVISALGYTPSSGTPTLDQVTTAGNTTTNAISVGGLTSNASSIILGAAAGTLGSKVLTLEGSLPELFFKDTFSTGSGFSLSKYGSAFYFVRTSSTGVFTNYAGAIVNNSWSLGHGGNPNATVHIKGADVLSSTKTLLVQNSSPTDLLTIWNDGAVGINTSTNAGYKLDVNGTARIVNSLTVNNNIIAGSGVYTPTVVLSATNLYRVIQNDVGGLVIRTNAYGLQINDIGTGTLNNAFLTVSGSKTASAALAQGVYFNNTLVASANNDVLVGLDINPTFTNGAFTGVENYALRVKGSTQYIFTTGDGLILNRDGAGNYIRPITQPLVLYSPNSSVYQYINNSGVGINTPPSARFHIKGSGSTSSTTTLKLENSLSTASLIVNDGGNVLIGTTTDAGYKLQVNGDATINGVRVGLGGGSVSSNTVVGSSALNANTTGSRTIAVGESALQLNTTGANQVAIGWRALYLNSTGNANQAFGYRALENNTTGGNNTAVGYQTLQGNISGSSNVGVGNLSLYNNTASNNTAVGYEAGYSNTSGTDITAIGYQSLRANTTGASNVGVGTQTLYSNTTGEQNTAIGRQALRLNTTGGYNSAVGFFSLYNNTTGNQNVAHGVNALYANTIGAYNTAIGLSSLRFNIDGTFNTAIGQTAGYSNVSGSNNVFIGRGAGYNETGSNKLYIGNSSTNTLIYGDFSTGNVSIGSTVDAGYKLDVNGTLRAQNENGTNALSFDEIASFKRTTTNQSISLGYYSRNTTTTDGVGIAFGVTYLNFIHSTNTIVGGVSYSGNWSLMPTGLHSINFTSATSAAAKGYIIGESQTGFITDTNYATVYGTRNSSGVSGDIVVQARSRTDSGLHLATGVTPQTRLYISEGGNVGIGTSTPTYKLQVGDLTTNNSNKVVIATLNTGVNGFYVYASSNIRAGIESDYNNTLTRIIGAYNGGTNIIGQDTNNGHTILYSGSSSTERARIAGSTGNVLIGTTTDAGYKLDVNGSVKFGTGLYWDNTNNRLGIGTSTPSRSLQVVGIIKATSLLVDGVGSEGSTIYLGGGSVRTYTNSSNPDGYVHYITTSGSGQDRTSGTYGSYSTTHTFAPTSGTSTYNGLNIGISINQTGGANGITRGLYINPTLTSVADFRAIETTAGNVIFNGGNVGIGTTAPEGPLHVKYSSSTLPGITIENDGVGYNAGSMTLRSGTTGGTNMSVTVGGGMYWYNLDSSSNTLSLPATGNLIVGGAVDAGYRLDVQGGDARFAQNVEAASYSVAGNAGYSGIINFPGNPPGFQNLEFLQGILINVF